MPNRIIKESICTSENINALSAEAERLFCRLMVKADDFGCYHGNIKIIKSTCFPLKSDEIKDKQMTSWISELVSADLVFLYTAEDEKAYLKLTKWEKHQQRRATKPKFPLPKSNDIKCNQVKPNVPVIVFENENVFVNENDILHSEIFDFWNSQNIIVHKKLTQELKSDIKKALAFTAKDEIKTAIERYSEMYHDQEYEYCNYKWGLHELLTRREGYKRFLDDGSKWLNYLDFKKRANQKKDNANLDRKYDYDGEDTL